MRLFLLGNYSLQPVNNILHVIFGNEALGKAVAHQRVNSQLTIASIKSIIQIVEGMFADVLWKVKVNDFLVVPQYLKRDHNDEYYY